MTHNVTKWNQHLYEEYNHFNENNDINIAAFQYEHGGINKYTSNIEKESLIKTSLNDLQNVLIVQGIMYISQYMNILQSTLKIYYYNDIKNDLCKVYDDNNDDWNCFHKITNWSQYIKNKNSSKIINEIKSANKLFTNDNDNEPQILFATREFLIDFEKCGQLQTEKKYKLLTEEECNDKTSQRQQNIFKYIDLSSSYRYE